MSSSPASDTSSVAAHATAAAPARGTAPLRSPQEAEGRHTLHIKYVRRTDSYTIIHTNPNGKREVWRRDLTLEDARLRVIFVADMLGYEARL